MKKILMTLFLVSSLVFTLAAGAMASNVYVDGMINGKHKLDYSDGAPSEKFDLSGFGLGANLTFDRFLINTEYEKTTDEMTGGDVDVDTINLTVGYALFADEKNYVALTAGYNQRKLVDHFGVKFSGAIIGLNAVGNLGERSRLEGFVGYSVSGTYKEDGMTDTDIDILMLQAKYSFFFTENFGVGIGYKSTQYKFDPNSESYSKTTFSGPTVGLTYNF